MVSFTCESGKAGQKALEVQLISLSSSNLLELLLKLKDEQGSSQNLAYVAYLREIEQVLFSSQLKLRLQIIQELFQDLSGRCLLNQFNDRSGVYRHLLQVSSLAYLIDQGIALESIPTELIRENEEAVCRLICSGRITEVSKGFVDSAHVPVLYACALVNIIDCQLIQGQTNELNTYLREKFMNPSGASAVLYKDIYDECIKRIGGYKASPVVWDVLSELLLKKFLFERNFHKAESLFNSPVGLSEKIDCFIIFNLTQLLAAGNDLSTTYNIFVHMLWQALANQQVDIETQVSRILSLFPSCGTVKLLVASGGDEARRKPDPYASGHVDELLWGAAGTATMDAELSCEAVYWEKQNKYLCRGSVCSKPQIRPDLERNFLDYTIYDWLVHFGVEFWGSDNHQVRDFPIKLAGYFNRLREILSRLHCRSCNNLMLPDFKYSRVKCSVYENGQWVEKDMAAAYRNTLFYCNDKACSEFGHRYYINHCLESRCYDLIDSRDLKVKCDSGLLVCKGCGSCCPQHGKTSPVGFCPECGTHLQLYEDPGQVSPFGRNVRFVRCSNQGCSFELNEPRLPKKFYLKSSQPVHIVRDYS